VGDRGRVIGLDRFGESAPAGELFIHFGFTTDALVAAARATLQRM
jgi:transketolase